MGLNEELVMRYQNGDHTALDELTNRNLRLIRFVANKYYFSKCNYIDLEDLTQVGWFGLLRAAEKYRADNGASFSTYAIYGIRQSISRYIHQKSSKFNETSLNEPVKEDSDITLIDMIQDEDDETFKEMWHRLEILGLRMDLEGLLNTLPLRYREIVKLYYGWDAEPLDFKEIGEIFGITFQGVAYIHHQAVIRLRRTGWARTRIMERKREKEERLKFLNPALYLLMNS